MLFRSPSATPIRIALTSGHTAVVGPEWRELPSILHYDAVALGCERDDRAPPPPQEAVKAGKSAINQAPTYDDAYRKALLEMLGRDEEGDFTVDSLPNNNAVAKLCGFAANKTDVLRVFRALKDEATAAAAAAKDRADEAAEAARVKAVADEAEADAAKAAEEAKAVEAKRVADEAAEVKAKDAVKAAAKAKAAEAAKPKASTGKPKA